MSAAFDWDKVKVRKVDSIKPAKSQRGQRYVQITETGARALDGVIGCSVSLVWFEILFRVWQAGKMTIELGNRTLAGMGVSRWAKYRALARLEEAELIRVERRRSPQSLTITLLKRGCIARA